MLGAPIVGFLVAHESYSRRIARRSSGGDFLGRLSFDCLAVLAASGARHGKSGNSDF
jgi:hypothetical protein